VTGLLRINTVRVALGMALTPILSKLAWQHPRLTVEVYAADALVDIVERGFDAGIRRGKLLQRDMIAMRLTRPFRGILVASREYIEAKRVPKTIVDLHRHNCIGMRLTGSGGILDWELMDGKKIATVKTSGTALVTDSTHALELASAGVGVAYAAEPLARRYIREGRLKWLLPQCAVEYDGLVLYYPRRASLAPKLRVFIEAAKTVLRQ
jgi:DNA-binding transcriptional LysR family regulator